MSLNIKPITSLKGEIIAPPSKSYSHRAFIAASLAKGVSIIKNPLVLGDVGITIEILKNLGVKIFRIDHNSYIVRKTDKIFKKPDHVLDCKNSGTSIRIFAALSLLIDEGLSFQGEFLKRKRPILPFLNSLKALGAKYKLTENELAIKRVKFICKKVKIPGNISSQFITAFLIICPLLKCKGSDYITVEIISPIISYPYIRITTNVLNSFGINILEDLNEKRTGKFYINCEQTYRTQTFAIPGDFSSIANIIVATILSRDDSEVIIHNLDFEKPQGDKRIIKILQKMGANIKINSKKGAIIIKGNLSKYPLKGMEIDIRDNPDLFPILSIVGAFAENKTTLYNIRSLKFKESDRISTVTRELNKMGVKLEINQDKLIIYQCNKLNGIVINHENDHRIAMAFVVASLYADSESVIHNETVIKDSYPNFTTDLNKLGAKIVLK